MKASPLFGRNACLAALLALGASASAATITLTPVSAGSETAGNNNFVNFRNAVNTAAVGDIIELDGTAGVFDWGTPQSFAAYKAGAGNDPATVATENVTAQYGVYYPKSNNVTIRGINGAHIKMTPDTALTEPGDSVGGGDVGDYSFIVVPGSAATGGYQARANTLTGQNVTFDGLQLTGFERFFQVLGKTTGFTVRNCTLNVGAYRCIDARGFNMTPNSGGSPNTTIQNNTINIIANAALASDFGNDPNLYPYIYGILFRTVYGGSAALDNLLVDGNTFNATWDPTRGPGPSSPSFEITNGSYAIDENGSANLNSDMTFSNNVFNAAAVDGGDKYTLMTVAAAYVSKTGEYFSPTRAQVIRWSNNTYNDTAYALYPFAWAPAPSEDTVVMPSTTFNNCGLSYDVPAIINALGSSFGSAGPSKIVFDLNLTIDGVTGVDALHAAANDPFLFQRISDGVGGQVEFGILGARIEPAAAPVDIVNDPAFTGLPYWTAPPGNPTKAIGYNAFGNTIDNGQPNDFITGLGAAGTYVVTLTADTEYAPNTRIPTGYDVTIKSNAGNKWKVSPKGRNLAAPLFSVEGTGILRLQDLEINGDAPLYGNADVLQSVSFPVTGNSQLRVDRCVFTNFIDAAIKLGSGETLVVNDSDFLFTPIGKGIETAASTNVTVTNCIFDTLTYGVNFTGSGSTVVLKKNLFANNVDTFFFASNPASLTIGGAPGDGNYFFRGINVEFNGIAGPPATLNFSHNWHGDIFGYAANDASGLVTGDIDVDNSGGALLANKDVISGQRQYFDTGNSLRLTEASIVSQFDRDVDGLADVRELNGVTAYNDIDTDDDNVPDGAEVTLATDPNNAGSFPAGFVLDADLDSDRRADWYVDALEAQRLAFTTNTTLFLGDVTDNQLVQLSDAVRALQIVNSALPFTTSSGNLNAINVTGQAPNQIANPLAILRYQAGVRNLFPAIPGID